MTSSAPKTTGFIRVRDKFRPRPGAGEHAASAPSVTPPPPAPDPDPRLVTAGVAAALLGAVVAAILGRRLWVLRVQRTG